MKQPEWTRKLGMALTFLFLFLIILFSLESSSSVPSVSWIPLADKGAHALAYAALGFALALWMPGKGRVPSGILFLLFFLPIVIMGACLELLQPTFGRSRELLDLFADGIGGFVGLLFPFLVFRDGRKSG